MIHELKCWPEFFDAIERGDKTFEIRRDDRGIQVGDTLRLQRWRPDGTGNGLYVRAAGNQNEMGRRWFEEEQGHASIFLRVTYKMHGGQFGIDPLFCVLGFKREEEKQA